MFIFLFFVFMNAPVIYAQFEESAPELRAIDCAVTNDCPNSSIANEESPQMASSQIFSEEKTKDMQQFFSVGYSTNRQVQIYLGNLIQQKWKYGITAHYLTSSLKASNLGLEGLLQAEHDILYPDGRNIHFSSFAAGIFGGTQFELTKSLKLSCLMELNYQKTKARYDENIIYSGIFSGEKTYGQAISLASSLDLSYFFSSHFAVNLGLKVQKNQIFTLSKGHSLTLENPSQENLSLEYDRFMKKILLGLSLGVSFFW